MYKSRFRLWAIVFIVYIIFSLFSNNVFTTNKITINSNNTTFTRSLSGKKIGNGNKLITGQNAPDIFVKENDSSSLEGYEQEAFYSPIVAIIDKDIWSKGIFKNTGSDHPYTGVIDTEKILNGFLDDMTYNELYPYSNQAETWNPTKISIAVNTDYEQEIKQCLLFAFADTTNLTSEDIETYMPKVNEVWEKAEKISTSKLSNYADENKNFVVFSPEYTIPFLYDRNNVIGQSLTNTVVIDFYVNYKEEQKNVILSDNFMKNTALRRASYNDALSGGYLKYSDWSVNIVDLSEEQKAEIAENSVLYEEPIETEDVAEEEPILPILEEQETETTVETEQETDIDEEAEDLENDVSEQSDVESSQDEEAEEESMFSLG